MKNKYFSSAILFASLFLCLVFGSCYKDYSIEGVKVTSDLSSDTIITDSSIFIDITIDGVRTIGIQNLDVNPSPWGQMWGGYFSTGDSSIYPGNRTGAIFFKNSPPVSQFYFTKGNYFKGADYSSIVPIPSVSFIDSFFAPGNYNYSVKANDTSYFPPPNTIGTIITQHLLTNGISLSWVDITGKLWTTFYGTADQAGSYFTIVKNEIPNVISWGDITTVTANFACKLYDNNGNIIHLTNGSFRQPVLN